MRKIVSAAVLAAATAGGIGINDWLSVNGSNQVVYMRQKEDGHRWTWDIFQTEVWAWRFAVGAETEFNHPRRQTFVGLPDLEGDELVQYYGRYRDNYFDARGGTFDKTLGKGMILRSYLDRDFNIYNLLTGGTGTFHADLGGRQWGDVTALWGRNDRRNRDLQTRYDTVTGGEITLRPLDFFYVTGSGVQADVENYTLHYLERERLFGGGLGASFAVVDFYGEYAVRDGFNFITNEDGNGDGVYAVVNGYLPRSSVSAEFKRYNDLSYPYNTPPPASVDTRMLTGPTSPYRGEWGYYVKATANPLDPLRVTGGYSYADNEVGEQTEKTAEIKEYEASARYDTPMDLVAEARYQYLGDVGWSEDLQGQTIQIGDRRRIPSLRLSWTLWDDHSFFTEYQHEWRDEYTLGEKYQDNRVYAGYTYSSWLGLNVDYEDTDELVQELVNTGPPAEYRYKHNWLWGEARLTYFHKWFQNQTLAVGYGSRRGGLVCSSGQCKQESPFTGFRVTLESVF